MSARSDNFDFLPSLRRRILRVGGSDGSRKTGRPKPPHRIAHIPEVVDQMLQMTREQLAVEICGTVMRADELEARVKVVELEALALIMRQGTQKFNKKRRARLTQLIALVFLVIGMGTIAFSVICSTPLEEREYCKNSEGEKCDWTHAAEAAGECTCIEQSCVGFTGYLNQLNAAAGTGSTLNTDLWSGFYLTIVTVTTIGYGDLYPQSKDGRTFMVVYVTIVLGVIAYLLNFLQEEGSRTDQDEPDYVAEFADANTAQMWKAKAATLQHNVSAAEVTGLLEHEYSKKTLGPEPNVPREIIKLSLAIIGFIAVSSAVSYLLHWYVGWSWISAFYFTWYTASTVGYGDYGGFECVRPSRFPYPYIGKFDVARVDNGNTVPIEGECRGPDTDPFAKFLVLVVIVVSLGMMSIVISFLQGLVARSYEHALFQHRFRELKNAMRRAAFTLIQDRFDELDNDGGGELSMAEISDFLTRQGLSMRNVKKLMIELDDDKSGSLSKDEIDAQCSQLERDRFRDLVHRFRELDVNNDEVLDINELKHLMPEGTAMVEVVALRNKLDANGDGVIELSELMAIAKPDAQSELKRHRKKMLERMTPFIRAVALFIIRELFVHASAFAWTFLGEYREGTAAVYTMGSADKTSVLDNHAVGDPWTYADSLYFVTITISTVGFGDFTPSNDVGRLFCIVWGTIGIAVHLATLDACAHALHVLLSPPCVWVGTLQADFFDHILKQGEVLPLKNWRCYVQFRRAWCCICDKVDAAKRNDTGVPEGLPGVDLNASVEMTSPQRATFANAMKERKENESAEAEAATDLSTRSRLNRLSMKLDKRQGGSDAGIVLQQQLQQMQMHADAAAAMEQSADSASSRGLTEEQQKKYNLARTWLSLLFDRDPKEFGKVVECCVVLCIWGSILIIGGDILDSLGTKLISQPENYLMQNFLTTIGFGDFKAETLEQKIFFYIICVPGHSVTTAMLTAVAAQLINALQKVRSLGRHTKTSAREHDFEIHQTQVAKPPLFEVGAGALHALSIIHNQLDQERFDTSRRETKSFAKKRRSSLLPERSDELSRREETALKKLFDAVGGDAETRSSQDHHAHPPPAEVTPTAATTSARGGATVDASDSFDTSNPMRRPLEGREREPPLPEGWVQRTRGSGAVYYYCTATGEKTYDRPQRPQHHQSGGSSEDY